MPEEQKNEFQQRRSVMWRLLMLWVVIVIGMGWCTSTAQYKGSFQSEFGYLPSEEGHPLAIASRLEALCSDYQRATAHAEDVLQKVLPSVMPGTEAERTQWIRDANERLARERAEQSRKHFIFSRKLAESVGPLPEIHGCQELISSDLE